MQEEIKRQWINRLLSGMYPQGFNKLRRDTEGKSFYCCLGVLCELALQAGIVTRVPDSDIREPDATVHRYISVKEPEGDFSALYLPKAVAEWAELDDVPQKNLAQMNDTGESFDAIAAQIERDL